LGSVSHAAVSYESYICSLVQAADGAAPLHYDTLATPLLLAADGSMGKHLLMMQHAPGLRFSTPVSKKRLCAPPPLPSDRLYHLRAPCNPHNHNLQPYCWILFAGDQPWRDG
jgi:hypothetical protein